MGHDMPGIVVVMHVGRRVCGLEVPRRRGRATPEAR